MKKGFNGKRVLPIFPKAKEMKFGRRAPTIREKKKAPYNPRDDKAQSKLPGFLK